MIINTKYDIGEKVKFKMLGHWSEGAVVGIYFNGKRTEYDVAFNHGCDSRGWPKKVTHIIRVKLTGIKKDKDE